MIFHIDMSNHYKQKSYSVLAMVSVNADHSQNHYIKKGVVITDPLRKELILNYSEAKLHAVLIYFLIKDINKIKKIIVCVDVKPIEKVMSYIAKLKPGLFGRVKSLFELREELGDSKIKSLADAFARNINRNFSKRKNVYRRKPYFKDSIIIFSTKKTKLAKKLKEKLELLNKK